MSTGGNTGASTSAASGGSGALVGNDLAPISATDAEIETALQSAHIPSLMAALVHVTGDPSIIRGDIRPETDFFGDPQGNIPEADQAAMRALALTALTALRDRAGALPPPPDRDVVAEITRFMIGQDVPSDYADFLTAELAIHGEDAFAPDSMEHLPEDARAAFHVAIIGSGMSGLLAAIRLKEAGSGLRSSRNTATSAARGIRTHTPVAAWTARITATPTVFGRTTGHSTTRSRKCCDSTSLTRRATMR